VRREFNEIERSLRSIGGTKAQGRVLCDLRDRTNDLESEVRKGAEDET
jgi:hypothetical protein